MQGRQGHAHPNPTRTLAVTPTLTPTRARTLTLTLTLNATLTAGSYTGNYSQTKCTTCPENNFCEMGAASPTACGPGTVGDRTGLADASECTPCYRGFWCSAGQAIACPGDTYNEVEGQTNQGACQPCPEFSVSLPGAPGRAHCVCRAGYYNTNSSEYPRCASCPRGTDCTSDGTTTATLQAVIEPGYYRHSHRSAEIRRCPDYRANQVRLRV